MLSFQFLNLTIYYHGCSLKYFNSSTKANDILHSHKYFLNFITFRFIVKMP